jgi:heat-inducible transcriptional repressor
MSEQSDRDAFPPDSVGDAAPDLAPRGPREALAERDRQILFAIVTDYIQSAEPVGSRTIARKYGLNLSPASVRNVMADLEEAGYLSQPHTSAGRIPTDKGFRAYVDSLEPRPLTRHEQERIRSRYQGAPHDSVEVMRETSRVLSALSNLAGVVVAPRLESTRFRHIEFVRLKGRDILVVLVSDTGAVHNKLIRSDEALTQDRLHEIANYLNGVVAGLTLDQARARLVDEMQADKAAYDQLYAEAQALARQALEGAEAAGGGELFLEGALAIIEQPEFASVEKMKALFKAFEDKSLLVRLLDKSMQARGMQVLIGHETEVSPIAGCSLILSHYTQGDRIVGTLGVIGPTRMNYQRVIPLVDYTARLVSRFLES